MNDAKERKIVYRQDMLRRMLSEAADALQVGLNIIYTGMFAILPMITAFY